MKKGESIITFDNYTAKYVLFGHYQITVEEYEKLKKEKEKKYNYNID